MIDDNKYSKLTPSAKEELDKITSEFREMLFERAFSIANERDTASKEISLRDILEAQQFLRQVNSRSNRIEEKKSRFFTLITISAIIYAIGGIIIYLVINKNFSFEKDLGLIIAIVGVLLALFSMLGLLFTKKFNNSSLFNSEKRIEKTEDNFELVRRWQKIEELSKKLMTESDEKGSTPNSVGFQIRFLSHKIAKDETEFLKIRELLQIRNKILHENYNISPKEFNQFIRFADELIERLEFIYDKQPKEVTSLKVIKALYGTPKNSIDATKVLNLLINNNRLEFIANNEIAGDPDVGTVKNLSITYEINGKEYTKIYNEGDKVIIDSNKK
jgi:hypothetical protein